MTAPLPVEVLRVRPGPGSLDLPRYQSPDAAGLDLLADLDQDLALAPGDRKLVPTGLAIALPPGYEAQARPRSGLALRTGLTVLNAPGTIDADYRGEIQVLLVNLGREPVTIRRGERIAQLVVAPVARIAWEEVPALAASSRGDGGFGSTGAGRAGVIARYSRPEMARIWSDEARLTHWLEVELALVDELAARGEVPAEAARTLRRDARVDVARMQEIEAEVKHDVIAFVSSVAERLGDESRFLHLGLTSSDVVDTAFALQLRDAADLLLAGLDALWSAVRTQAERHKHTAMIGRTHGIHAEPITFGLKCASWYAELSRGRRAVAEARALVAHGKLSGAVGTFASNPPEVEAGVCRRLGLAPEPLATQVVPRDRHAHFFTRLAIVAGTCERIATEIRHLQRTEVGEALEPFGRGQKGSSAMPHKRNPILTENLCGLARLVRGYALAALENMALWHERDISHSSVERVIAPDATIVLDFMLARLAGVVRDLDVRPAAMAENLARLGGAVFSEQVLLALVRRGVRRDDAYSLVQRHALAGDDLRGRLAADVEVTRHVPAAELAGLFDMQHALRHIDVLFSRALEDGDGSR